MICLDYASLAVLFISAVLFSTVFSLIIDFVVNKYFVKNKKSKRKGK